MEKAIEDFISSKRLAVMGASRSGKKFGNIASKELVKRGYQVFLVHPEAKEIDGEACYPGLSALQDKVDAVLICVSPPKAAQALQEAAASGLRNVWLQQGGDSPEVLNLARQLNLNLVTRKCVLMYAPPVGSFHAWHRAFAKLFGQL